MVHIYILHYLLLPGQEDTSARHYFSYSHDLVRLMIINCFNYGTSYAVPLFDGNRDHDQNQTRSKKGMLSPLKGSANQGLCDLAVSPNSGQETISWWTVQVLYPLVISVWCKNRQFSWSISNFHMAFFAVLQQQRSEHTYLNIWIIILI